MAKGFKTGGRQKGSPNKVTADIKSVAQSFGPEALEHLMSIARDVENAPAARVAAVKEILDRGFGKAKQPIEHSGEEGGPIMISEIKIIGVKPDGTEAT